MISKEQLFHYLDAYRSESSSILRQFYNHDPNRLSYQDPPEASAVESFLVVFCEDGAIAYGFSGKLRLRSDFLLGPSNGNITFDNRVIPFTMQEFTRWIGLYPVAPPASESELRMAEYESRTKFGTYLIRHSPATSLHGSIWENEPIESHGWYSVTLFGNQSIFPDPYELARRQWNTFRLERNLGSLATATNLIESFDDLLKMATKEEELQTFLEDNPEIITPHFIKCRPKFKLDKYVTDFVISSNDGYEFIEIEHPSKPIFTKQNQISSQLIQAENQILDWKVLIETDHSFFERRLSGLQHPRFRLIYGRNKGLTHEQEHKLALRFANIQFDTYDDISARFRRTIKNLQES